MKLLPDECCDAKLVEVLPEEGHDVTYVLESMCGASDASNPRVRASERIFRGIGRRESTHPSADLNTFYWPFCGRALLFLVAGIHKLGVEKLQRQAL